MKISRAGPAGPVPTWYRRARGDAVACPEGPNIKCAPIRNSRSICRAPSGPIGPKQGSDGNLLEPNMVRGDPTGLDGWLDCPVLMYG